jgi:hypothetical protein
MGEVKQKIISALDRMDTRSGQHEKTPGNDTEPKESRES